MEQGLKLKISILVLSSLIAAYIYFGRIFTGFGGSLFAFSISLIPIIFILLFFDQKIFNTWLKFAIGWVLLSAIFIILTPEYGADGGFGLNFNPGREMVGKLLATLFFFVSIAIITLKFYKSRKAN